MVQYKHGSLVEIMLETANEPYGTTMLALVGCCLGLAACSPKKALTLLGSDDVFFKEEEFTGSSYVHFRNQWHLQSHQEENHMFVEESDRGTWTRDSLGWSRCNLPCITGISKSGVGDLDLAHEYLGKTPANTRRHLETAKHQQIATNLSRTSSENDWCGSSLAERISTVQSPLMTKRNKSSRSQLSSLMRAIEVFTNRMDNQNFPCRTSGIQGVHILIVARCGNPVEPKSCGDQEVH